MAEVSVVPAELCSCLSPMCLLYREMDCGQFTGVVAHLSAWLATLKAGSTMSARLTKPGAGSATNTLLVSL